MIDLKPFFSQWPAIEKVLLFGSRARGDHQARADIDLAIACPTISENEWIYLREAIEEIPTLLEFDVVRFDTASKALQDVILREGKIIYERH